MRYRVVIRTCGGLSLEQSDSFRSLETARIIARKVMTDHAYDGAIAGVMICREGDRNESEEEREIVCRWEIKQGRKRYEGDHEDADRAFIEVKNPPYSERTGETINVEK